MIDWIKSARCYLLMCYSGDVDVGFGGRAGKKGSAGYEIQRRGN